MSNIQQRVIALYIHPDSGPVLPMQLDLMAIEMTALKAPDDTQRNEIRIREIAKCIRAKFPGVQPEGNRAELSSLIGRLSHYMHFNGIVLRLPGIINEETRADSQSRNSTEPVKQKLEQIEQQVEQQSRDLRKERQGHEDTKAQFSILKNNYRQLRILYDKIHTQLTDTQAREGKARLDAEYWCKTAEHINSAFSVAQQEVGTLQTQLDLMSQDIQALTTISQQQKQEGAEREQELSRLRQEARNAESTVKNLEATIRKRDQQIEQLRHQLESDDVLPSDKGSWDGNL